MTTNMLGVKKALIAATLVFIGAPKTNRTSDLPLRRGSLYPLSYRGVARILPNRAWIAERYQTSQLLHNTSAILKTAVDRS